MTTRQSEASVNTHLGVWLQKQMQDVSADATTISSLACQHANRTSTKSCGVAGLFRYLITAPLSLHLDATETVLLQLFGFTEPVSVFVFLRTSMAPGNVELDQADVTLDARNNHQAVVRLRVSLGRTRLLASLRSSL